MSNLKMVAILGRPDAPTDALIDYCGQLSEALSRLGVQLETVEVSWALDGWPRAPLRLWKESRAWRVCGSATNAFINLAIVSDVQTRRLLLLTPDRQTKHVLAEVYLDGRWVVVDPAFHVLFRDGQGRFVTRQELAEPPVFQDVTGRIPGYRPEYSFELTSHVRLARIPVVGHLLRKTLDTIAPGWEETINWTLVLERRSLLQTIMAVVLLCFGLACRFVVGWYGEKRLGINRVPLRTQVLRAGEILSRGSR